MTPREDLEGQPPRHFLHCGRDWVDHELHNRQMQWSNEGRCPRPLDRDTYAYRYGPLGRHEVDTNQLGAGNRQDILVHEPLVEQFVQAIGVFPVGSLVELSTGEVAVVQDANLEYDPHELPRLLQPILEGRADAVFGPLPHLMAELALGVDGGAARTRVRASAMLSPSAVTLRTRPPVDSSRPA